MNPYERNALSEENGEEILMYLALRDELPKCRTKAQFQKLLVDQYPDEPDSDEHEEIREQVDSIWPRRLEWEIEILRTLLKHAKEYAENPEQPLRDAGKKLEADRAQLEVDKRAKQENERVRTRTEERARFNAMSTEQLHKFVEDYHWDMNEMSRDDLRAVLHAPNCAKGTALFMFWQLEGFFNFDKIGYVRNYPHKFPETRDVDGEERIRRTDSFIIEVFGRIVGNAFKVNSIPFDIVSYLEDSAHSKVKDEYGVVPPEIRKHVPRCLTNSKYDASVAW